MAFDRLDPIGDERGDILHAKLCQLVAAVGGDPDPKLDAFMPQWAATSKPPKRKGMQITGDALKMIFTLAGETVVDTRPGHGGSR